ncbi:class I SAM-dependent methyltransferase [Bacillus paralicheniformis]|uniref:class I SAM-dependent methyltransferase n=1 Tax=Bacillus paralicheniformis TaxID=1648923 RepID=UPI000D0440ED|nr:class I SAM-dependent methyltransferase [Bacillus paralicheniformis]
MKEPNSYQINKIAIDVDKEIKRLQAQVELFWPKEIKHYIEFGLADGMVVGEFGSGPGFVTDKLLSLFPSLQVKSVELDALLANYASDFLTERYGSRVEVIEGSILEIPMEENSIDIAITRLVLEHLKDPEQAVKEVYRVLKPGGRALFIDNDFEMHIMTYPHIPELRKLYEAYCIARIDEGGKPKIGRELPMVLYQAGFEKIDFEVISAHSSILGDEMFFKSEGIGIPSKLVKDGYLPSKTLGEISRKWSRMIKDEKHSIIRQLYMAVGEKSPQKE